MKQRLHQLKLSLLQCHTVFQREKGWKSFLSALVMTVLITMVTTEDLYVHSQATETGMFTLACACIWSGLFQSLRTICRERAIVKREHATGLHISSYVLGRWLYEACICVVLALIINTVMWIANRTRYTHSAILFAPYIEYGITCFFILFASDSLGIAISASVRNENSALTVMPFALILQLILGGLIFPLKGISKILSALTVSRWGLNALCITARVNALDGYVLKDAYAMTASNLTHMWLILFGFAVLYAAIAVLVLEFIDSDPR